MATQGSGTDQAWADLAELPEAQRQPEMRRRYIELLALSEEERRNQMVAMAKAEYGLLDDKLRSFTRSRILVWLAMDTGAAGKLSSSYNAVMLHMPGPAAMRRVAHDQTVARELSLEDQARLRALLPAVLGGIPAIPPTIKEVLTAAPTAPQQASPAKQETPTKKGGFWPFRKK